MVRSNLGFWEAGGVIKEVKKLGKVYEDVLERGDNTFLACFPWDDAPFIFSHVTLVSLLSFDFLLSPRVWLVGDQLWESFRQDLLKDHVSNSTKTSLLH